MIFYKNIFVVIICGSAFNPDSQIPLLIKLFGPTSVVISSTLRRFIKVSQSIKNPLNQRVFCFKKSLCWPPLNLIPLQRFYQHQVRGNQQLSFFGGMRQGYRIKTMDSGTQNDEALLRHSHEGGNPVSKAKATCLVRLPCGRRSLY